MIRMNDIERLAKAATELGNHVAAVVRLSNVLTGILKDGDRDDLDPMTRRVVLHAAKMEHDSFRSAHFRGMIDALNEVVSTADAMYQAEPVATEPEPKSVLPEPGVTVLGDVTVPSEAPDGERPPVA